MRFVDGPRDIDRQIDFTRAVSGMNVLYSYTYMYMYVLFCYKNIRMKADSNNAAYYYIFVHLIRKNHNGTLYYIGLVQQCGQPSYMDAVERPYDNII